MGFNATFSNISVILWSSVLLVQEAGDYHRPFASYRQTLSYNFVPSTPRHEWVRTHNFSGDREIRPSYIIKRTQFLLLLHLLKFC
jgi:hypothetical protein